jgi:hypothetical protein
MKIEKTASGSRKITMSKKEWELIGKQDGWKKESQIIPDDGIADGGEPYTEDEMNLIQPQEIKKIYWSNVPKDAEIQLYGNEYIYNGMLVYWNDSEAIDAQRFLNGRVADTVQKTTEEP